jgi:uncharacterized OsmC-like protein
MSSTVRVKYLGDLRVESTHLASGAQILTDAPLDNNGKGEGFSPTDLCVTSLAACATTIMGIYGKQHGVDITGAEVEVTKIMSPSPPRRIAQIDVTFIMPDRDYSDKEKASLERAAKTCPVHLSLHPEVKQNLVFRWKK